MSFQSQDKYAFSKQSFQTFKYTKATSDWYKILYFSYAIAIFYILLTIYFMKQMRYQNTRERVARFGTGLDKQNTPFNATNQNNGQNAGKKMGIEIRSRIQKAENAANVSKYSLKNSCLIPGDTYKVRRSQSIMSTQTGLVKKSVSFDILERGVHSSLDKKSSKKSILKNSIIRPNPTSSMQKSQISIANSHVHSQDQSIENHIGNKVIKDKYQALVRDHKMNKLKYRDQIYPPVMSSLYLNNSSMKKFCQQFQKEGNKVQWMRLSELYKHKKIVVWAAEKAEKCNITKGLISKSGGDSDYLPTVFNLLKDKNRLLQKLFQSQFPNKQCIYYVKIHQTQTNIWKYVIVDDYIPVIINMKLAEKERYRVQNIRTALLGVQSKNNVMEIWPFLLQKAYAKYYSTYDSLGHGNTLDFLQEVTGSLLQQMKVKENIEQINKLLINEDAVVLGLDKKGIYHPIKSYLSSSTASNPYTYLDRESGLKQKELTFEQFTHKFAAISYAYLHKYYFTARCQIKQENIMTKTKKVIQPFILRSFTLSQSCQCQVAAMQKEQRFYRTHAIYTYAWIRMILVQKESTGYRWVAATYSNSKTAKITQYLTQGEYVVILMPQWRDKPYDFNLIFKGTTQVSFQRKSYELYTNILQESCMDLAQRSGKMVQVNKNICSYNYIEKRIGFVIENINNEKESNSVKVLRSIQGLQNYNIKAFNGQFKEKKTVQIVIPKMSHFTVILMTSNGVQRKFLDMFDFGV